MTVQSPFTGARKMRPTLKHRPAIWECMLGTVYARSADGQVRYFDYDWDGARTWAGVSPDLDVRLYKAARSISVGSQSVRKGQWVLWIR